MTRLAGLPLGVIFCSLASFRRHLRRPRRFQHRGCTQHKGIGPLRGAYSIADAVPTWLLGSSDCSHGRLGRIPRSTIRRRHFCFRLVRKLIRRQSSGGDSQEVQYTQNLAVGIALDLHKLVGLRDTYFLASVSERAGNSLSQDIPNVFRYSRFTAIKQSAVDLAVEKLLFDKRLDIVGGRINVLDDFATSPLYCFAQNLGFGGNPSVFQ